MVLRFLCGFSMAGVTLSTVILSEPQGRGQGGTCLALSQGLGLGLGLARPRPLWPWQRPSGALSEHNTM